MGDHTSKARATTLAVLLLTCLCAAHTHGQDAPAPLLNVKVIGAADGMPRPGVVVHACRIGNEPPGINAAGYAVAESLEIRRLRAAVTIRTDPEGRGVFAPGVGSRSHRFFLGGAHALAEPPQLEEGCLIITATDLQPVGVLATNTDGTPIKGMAVALRSAEHSIAFAITDATGRAMLGVPFEHKARLRVMPVGWVGAIDAFPTIAESLAHHRSVRLQLPPHGHLRLRFTRRGEPVKAKLHTVQLSDPRTMKRLHGNDTNQGTTMEAIGLEFPYVALGTECHARMWVDGTNQKVNAASMNEDGAQQVVDVELGSQPPISLTLLAKELPRPRQRLTLTTITDTQSCKFDLAADEKGRVEHRLREGILGTRLIAIELEAYERRENGASRAWFVHLPVGQDLSEDPLDFGAIQWRPRAPQLRGRVFNMDGSPAPGVRIDVRGEGQRTASTVVSDASGMFEYVGPLFRDENGRLLGATAKASRAFSRGEPVGTIPSGGEVELRLFAAPKETVSNRADARPRGRVIARIAAGLDASRLQLIMDSGISFLPKTTRAGPEGTTEVVFEELGGGNYTLCNLNDDVGRFAVLENLKVTLAGTCTDERLAAIDWRTTTDIATVRVLDAEDVPIAGARIHGGAYYRTTDGNGEARLRVLRGSNTLLTVTADRSRTQQVALTLPRTTVRLQPPGALTVKVLGLPDDLSREHIEVWVRHEDRATFAGPREKLGEGDRIDVAMPARGRYVIQVLVGKSNGRGGWKYSCEFESKATTVIADEPRLHVEVRMDAKTIERLRAAIARIR